MTIFWTILIAAFVVIEASTAQLVCIWFAGGALAALICAMCNLSIWMQITAFIVVTGLLLLLTKKIVRKLKSKEAEKTNTDALIGQTALVTEAISNRNSSGEAKLQGKVWTARSTNGDEIPAGNLVTVEEISGVKLMVKNKEEE